MISTVFTYTIITITKFNKFKNNNIIVENLKNFDICHFTTRRK